MAQYTKTDCSLYESEYCRILGADSCDACGAKSMSAGDAQSIREDIDVVRSLLPEGTLAPLYESPDCLFCKGERRKAEYYGLVDYAHIKPERKKTSAFGFKVKSKVGSIVPLQIACCKECRKNILTEDRIKFGVSSLGILATLLTLGLRPVREALAKAFEPLPLIIFLGMAAISLLAARLLSKGYAARKSAETEYDVNKIPFVARMVANGWFYPDEAKRRPHVIFSRERLKRGWFT